jgi:hypothetical protein
MRAEKIVTCYCVLYHVADNHHQAGGGANGDGSFIARFRSERDAEIFASGKEYYGKPAKVSRDDVPKRIAQRWGMA